MNVMTPHGCRTEDSDDGMEEVRDRKVKDWKWTEYKVKYDDVGLFASPSRPCMEAATQQRRYGNPLFTRPVFDPTVPIYEGIKHMAHCVDAH